MSSVCTEQHKFHPSYQQQQLSPKKILRDIDIPPRKLLTRRATATTYDGGADMFSDDFVQKFLPCNKLDDEDEESDDPYSSDYFRMYEFKVRRCTRSRSHDWTDCPFAHPGEKARRRDPRRYHYSGTVCPEYRRGSCSRGDNCEFAHGVFECWLHPARYRTEACKDGKKCKRKVCFFAHTPRQLRILPVSSQHSTSSNDNISLCKKNINNKLFLNSSSGSNNNNCCMFCHHCVGAANSASPTSTLFNMSHFSPPLSPLSTTNSPPFSPVKRAISGVNTNSYKDVVCELMNSMEGLNFGDGSPISAAKARNFAWLDMSLNNDDQQFLVSPSASPFGWEDQFVLSPSTQNPTRSNVGKCSNFSSKFFSNDNKVVDADINNGLSCPAPDLEWVNELLM
ncbi:hypothetical protein TanjilG_27447 [Lupinus angustifolius]|uniref:C3H1-type domain-containing protein n=1 Tax=Lupinus angustifolius TaxID=3871 RepID=A0A1J7G697_LUPAN|nr:PREDICTED: zinc finger CCCH domain-containing protein 2-like [Lupinus angustifolius]OIV89841.1 hypothetical protein TanjilG_27447 [Lupinus angustifolius]